MEEDKSDVENKGVKMTALGKNGLVVAVSTRQNH